MKYFLVSLLAISWNQGMLMAKDTLTFTQYIHWVERHHPITLQAALLNEQADAYQLKAKGWFDPSLDFYLDQKNFDEKKYYQTIYGGLKIPTWIGADVKLAYENNSGQFLDPSFSTPDNGLLIAGITIPLGNGLFFDERRMAVQEAKLLRQKNRFIQQQMINGLMYEAALAYLQWQMDFNKIKIQQEGVRLAEARLFQLVRSAQEGDKPAIDTVEARINLRNRQQMLLKANQAYIASGQNLNNFLWKEGILPLELDSLVFPESIGAEFMQDQAASIVVDLERVISTHPAIQLYQNYIAQFKVERKLQREMLKPTADLSFNPIISAAGSTESLNYRPNDFKMGVQMYFPLFVRKARGEIKLIDLDIETTELELAQKKLSIENKLQVYVQNEPNYFDQVRILQENVAAYGQLLEAENKKFEIGESLLFLVNNRELKLIEAREKIIETTFDLLHNRLKLILEAQRF